MRALRSVAAVALAVAGAAVMHTNTTAYTTFARWGTSPVTFYVNPANRDVSQAAAIAALQAGMDVWNTQAGTPFRYQYGGTVTDTATAYDNRNVIMFRNASNGSTIASTYSWWSSNNELLDSDIVFWDQTFTFFTGASGCGGVSNAAYMEDIAAHELGHALGLNHSTSTDATMYPSYAYCSQSNRTLAADDVAGAKALYPTTTTNSAPSVTLSSPLNGASYASGATVTFTGSASDTQDGILTPTLAWTSNIDGAIGFGGSFSRALSAGTHTIKATAVDAGGLQTVRQVSVTVAAPVAPPPPPPSGPTLSATGRKVKGYAKVDLKWNGLSGTAIDVIRDASKSMTTANDGSETDAVNKKGSFTVNYKVCAAGTTTCSNAVSVTF
jgi:hypothetical protein